MIKYASYPRITPTRYAGGCSNGTCVEECFSNINETMMSIFFECLLPTCQCAQIVEKGKGNNNTVPVNGSAIDAKINANLVNMTVESCDIECSSGCMEIKKFVPIEAIAICQRSRCGCSFEYGRNLSEQFPILPTNISTIIEVSNLNET